MNYRRIRALLCLFSFIAGLTLSAAAPVAAQSPLYNPYNYNSYGGGMPPANSNFYNYQYGNNVSVQTQQRGYSVFPAVIGGVAGLAIGGIAGGPVGALAGGAGGFALGNVLATKFGRNLGPQGYPQMVNTGFWANMIPGLAGGVLGLVLTASMGPMAWLIGGTAGFFAGKLIARMLFPQIYYGGSVYPTQQTYYGSPSVTVNVVQPRYSTPMAATDSAKATQSLEELKKTFYDAMHDYRVALKDGSIGEQQEARKSYLAAQHEYFEAKRTEATETK